MRIPKLVVAGAALVLASVLVGEPLAAPSSRERVQAETQHAQLVLQQVNALDLKFGRTVEAWHGAQYARDQARRRLAADRVALRIAEHQRQLALEQVRRRLVGLYESSDQPTTIGILFGSATVSDMIARIDAAQTVASADHSLAVETTRARDRYAATLRRTRAVERRRAAAVIQLQAERARIGAMLAERRQLLGSIHTQIAKLKAQEAARQAVLAAQARERLALEQAALRERAAAEARAAAATRRAALQAAAAPAPAEAPAAPPSATTTLATSTATTESAPPATSVPSPTAAPPLPVAAAATGHPEAATIAMGYLGVPYVWGGSTPAGFDCSGLVMYVYGKLGISLPHFAAAQYGFGTPVSRSDLQPGDLVFFNGLSHVGIYIGGGEMIHAPHTGDVVKISPLSDFGAGYVGARRL
jgi:cell wall-associated NlpC family hydrolase